MNRRNVSIVLLLLASGCSGPAGQGTVDLNVPEGNEVITISLPGMA